MWSPMREFFENQSCLELANKELMRRGDKECNSVRESYKSVGVFMIQGEPPLLLGPVESK